MSEDYYATLMDLWLLAIHYNLPVIFFTGTKLVENGLDFLVANSPATTADSYYFINVPGKKIDMPNPKGFRLVIAPKYNDLVPLSALRDKAFATQLKENIMADALLNYFQVVTSQEETIKLKQKEVKLVPVQAKAKAAVAPAVAVAPATEPITKGKKIGKKLVLTSKT
jgi:hypothetical protein